MSTKLEPVDVLAGAGLVGMIGTLACRAADAIKEHYLKRPGALLGN